MARLRRGRLLLGAASVGEVSVQNLWAARPRGPVESRACGTWSASRGPGTSKLCVFSSLWRRVPASKGRHTGTPLTGQPPHLPAAPPAPSSVPSSDSSFPSSSAFSLLGCGDSPAFGVAGCRTSHPEFLGGELRRRCTAALPPPPAPGMGVNARHWFRKGSGFTTTPP